jgi:hypothetical protein
MDCKSPVIKLSTFIFSSFFLSTTHKSAAIKQAVSKSREEVIPVNILFSNNFFITSGKGIHIFSENSFTVIFSFTSTSCFFIKLAEVVAIFSFFTTSSLGAFDSTLVKVLLVKLLLECCPEKVFGPSHGL